MSKGSNFIPSVNSSLKVLELLTNEQSQSSTLSEISSALNINKSTCLRILKTMERRGFVQYNEQTKRYKLGSYLIALGARAREVNDYIDIAISNLPSICQKIGQTVVLTKQTDSFNMVYIAKEESENHIRLTVSTGESFPIIGGAAGKAYMAYLSEEKIKEIVEHYTVEGKLPAYTKNSITDPDAFLEDLKSIQEKGMAETNSEHTIGIYAISSPIFNSKNEVILSIAAFIPSFALTDLDLSNIRETIKKYAEKISGEISLYV